jgi:ABC-type amino acid transport substrate-binding protein
VIYGTDLLYSDPIIFDTEVLYYLKEFPLEWESVKDLRGKSIGATAHTTYPLFEEAQRENIILY